MYPVSESSFVAHKATPTERKVIAHWYATVPSADQKYVRWMRSDDLLVVVAKPVNIYTRGYRPWLDLNTKVIVDPVRCEIHAGTAGMIGTQ